MCLFPLTTLLHQGSLMMKQFPMCYYLDDLKLYAKSKDDMVSLVNTVRIFLLAYEWILDLRNVQLYQ